MTDDKVAAMRKAFEAWCKLENPKYKSHDDGVSNRRDWTIWQAATAQATAAQWMPIETAPKDGTAVLVMRDIWPGTKSGRAEECNGHNTYIAAWWSGEGPNGAWVCYMDAVCDPICPIEPTHWQPLPQPPIAAGEALEGGT
jgi:hypothetical protein